jgi:hypothetical protein
MYGNQPQPVSAKAEPARNHLWAARWLSSLQGLYDSPNAQAMQRQKNPTHLTRHTGNQCRQEQDLGVSAGGFKLSATVSKRMVRS